MKCNLLIPLSLLFSILAACTTPDSVEPQNHITPEPPATTSASRAEIQQRNLCKQGLTHACIDLAYTQLKNRKGRNHAPLIRYCEEGFGSACYYMSQLKGERDYLARACALGDYRGCPQTMRTLYKTPSTNSCQREHAEFEEDHARAEERWAARQAKIDAMSEEERAEYLKDREKKEQLFQQEHARSKAQQEADPKRDYIKSKRKIGMRNLHAALAPLTYCFERKQHHQRKKIAIQQATYTIHFTADAKTGKISNSYLSCSDFYDAEINTCLTEIVSLYVYDLEDLAEKYPEYYSEDSSNFVGSAYLTNAN